MATTIRTQGINEAAPLIAIGLFSYQIGGSERIGADVAIECMRRGYRVLCFALYDSAGPMRDELEASGVECLDMSYLSRLRFVRRFTYQLALFRFFRRRNVHVVHIHHATSLILSALPARAAGVARIIMTEHSIIEFQRKPRYRRQSRLYCRFAHGISVIHPSMEPYFRAELGVPASKLRYIPNGVRLLRGDPAERLRLRQELGVDNSEFLWMFAGRLAIVKDIGTLIRAFGIARSRTAVGNLRLVIVGDGPERTALEQLCQSLELGAVVIFLGVRANVPRLMRAADGFAMSSLSEGLPIVLLEAMAAQLACVATSVGGIPELFSGGAGVLTSPQDALGLADAMITIAADPARRRDMTRAGFAKVAAANGLERVVDQYLKLFELPPSWPPSRAIGVRELDAV
jgi:glycosyltransferase involved in cell wall biosynthesis